MLIAYLNRRMFEPREIAAENKELLKEAVWIDLLSPTKEEETLIEQMLSLGIPSRAEMAEIETSSRLYKEHDSLFMTVAMLAQADSTEPKFDPVTFVLTETQLITIRYIEPQSFKTFASQLSKTESTQRQALNLFLKLIDTTVDRLADILEIIGHRLELYSKKIFRPADSLTEKPDYREMMQDIGANGDLNTKVRESLITLSRLVIFFGQAMETKMEHIEQLHITTQSKDIASLSDHAHFLSGKVSFLLDATLGMVNIEQNNIIKIFSVAAVIFLPPTLIASIYGMNFHGIPELSWEYGYVYSIIMMGLAAFLPYKYFKHKKWL